MGKTLNSIDDILRSQADNGIWKAFGKTYTSTSTGATTSSGYVTAQKYKHIMQMMSSFGSGITGAFLTSGNMVTTIAGLNIAGIDYKMATIDLSVGTPSYPYSMPTKMVLGDSIQTASIFTVLHIQTTLVATSPVVTLTYTNQDGTGSRTAALTIPTNAIKKSCFLVSPHLQSGDTGIRAITGMTVSTGSAGVIEVFGVLPLLITVAGTGAYYPCNFFSSPFPKYIVEASEYIGFYRLSSTTGGTDMIYNLEFTGDN